MVVVAGLTERLLPLPTKVPPQASVYHLITSLVPPPPPFNVRMALCPLQIVVEEAVAEVGSLDRWLTVTVALPVMPEDTAVQNASLNEVMV